MRFKVGDLVGFLATLKDYRFAIVSHSEPYARVPYYITPLQSRTFDRARNVQLPAETGDLESAVVTFGGPIVVKDR